MKFSSALTVGAAALPGAAAWGSLGHVTVAYVASNFVAPETAAYFRSLLGTSGEDYLASVATWADSVRYTRWGRFTGPFHFIDAKDSPPSYCGVELARDCKAEGCVVSAINNYTARVLDASLDRRQRVDAAKFVVHFVGDIHQPLHDEDVARGGNGIRVVFDGAPVNLHAVWDTSIPEKMTGGHHRKPFVQAREWAGQLTDKIRLGEFRSQSRKWLDGLDFADPEATALSWAREGNAYVCTHVLPEGPKAIEQQELGSDYFDAAAPVVEVQVARAGYRLAAWLDQIAANAPPETVGDL